MTIKNILSIAGSDPSGGAGVQADLKTFAALGSYGMAVITALTAQNTCGVQGVQAVPPDFVAQQIYSVLDDVRVDAVKIGMLGSAGVIAAVAEALADYEGSVVLDPVMVATSGDRLLDEAAYEALVSQLIPLASLVTPNIPEAEALLRKAVLDMGREALALSDKLGTAVLLKGGHGSGADSVDVLARDGAVQSFSAPRVDTDNTHGTGCTLSSAIACYLGHGLNMAEAVERAKAYVTGALKGSGELDVGMGNGPLWHQY